MVACRCGGEIASCIYTVCVNQFSLATVLDLSINKSSMQLNSQEPRASSMQISCFSLLASYCRVSSAVGVPLLFPAFCCDPLLLHTMHTFKFTRQPSGALH